MSILGGEITPLDDVQWFAGLTISSCLFLFINSNFLKKNLLLLFIQDFIMYPLIFSVTFRSLQKNHHQLTYILSSRQNGNLHLIGLLDLSGN